LIDVAINMALFGVPMGGGKGGGLLGGLFRANGGSVMAGQSYVVGERGPELFTPGRSGSIAPNSAMGGSNIVVNVDATGTSVQGNSDDSKRLGEAIGVAIRQELIKQKRPGGLLS
jgi:phage-related minor tail protein